MHRCAPMMVRMPHPAFPEDEGSAPDRRRATRNQTTHLVSVRVHPDRDGPQFPGKLQDVSAGGIGLLTERAVSLGAAFLVRPFRETGRSGISLLYRAVRCEARGGQFLVGGVLISAAGDIERDAKGQIVPAELERVRRMLTAA
jgi:hypothetical protein